MNYEIGQTFLWKPINQFDKSEIVTVVALRKGGHAKLSNGWVVDAYGYAEGTKMMPGGRVEKA
jgi:hypothetical protein